VWLEIEFGIVIMVLVFGLFGVFVLKVVVYKIDLCDLDWYFCDVVVLLVCIDDLFVECEGFIGFD